jgi:hypothetical protein
VGRASTGGALGRRGRWRRGRRAGALGRRGGAKPTRCGTAGCLGGAAGGGGIRDDEGNDDAVQAGTQEVAGRASTGRGRGGRASTGRCAWAARRGETDPLRHGRAPGRRGRWWRGAAGRNRPVAAPARGAILSKCSPDVHVARAGASPPAKFAGSDPIGRSETPCLGRI